ncbi:peptide/nickel transport system ATP-binding protein/oligopeptide transport system ATP-binding protein [Nitratireductor aquibiodomus]|uniref:Peptide/nickel transport system ATP-binding protein/oligopeptide transport system ATP-binding protein n=1 Tax=Nitratireductor aquibiodomus TaxID=204799 RepID=A0A1H4L559_9HYPH|nr:ABC transporter ATP-binding protein [Nitratireductor aquibiodomus]SEB65302.1 peptide/nickel transport system ATP-binding protein/oligopeptide transport system ATP-binding protein [Nitratireductor aquibiodomus]
MIVADPNTVAEQPDPVQDDILRVKDLRVELRVEKGVLAAVDDISFNLKRGETLGIVGESGCGKSMTALSIMGLLPKPIGRIAQGSIAIEGVGDVASMSERQRMKVRGNQVSMIFQEPMTSLNPVFTVGFQISEAIRTHETVSKEAARKRAIQMLDLVGIPLPEMRYDSYPHQLSGGMRQRVMIAMALACRPQIMLADEPTTALDVTIQAQILKLMNRLKEEIGTSILFITHDLGVIAKMTQRVLVMYAGVIVEEAPVRDLFAKPLHPYTAGLLRSIPRVDKAAGRQRRLHTIKGVVPNLLSLPRGCRFSDRCPDVHEPCRKWEPPLASPEDGPDDGSRRVRCWLHKRPPAHD